MNKDEATRILSKHVSDSDVRWRGCKDNVLDAIIEAAESKSQKSASLPCVTQWVAVEDRLPDTPWTIVNVLLKNGVVSSMIYSDVGEPWRWYNSSSRAQFPSETNPVIKWATLPEPPCG